MKRRTLLGFSLAFSFLSRANLHLSESGGSEEVKFRKLEDPRRGKPEDPKLEGNGGFRKLNSP